MLKIKEVNYEKFSVNERMNLTLAALSRSDLEEVRRLYKTCPKYRYLATDYEFTRRLDAITWVGEKYAELCQYFYDKALILQASILGVMLAGEELANRMAFSSVDMEQARIGYISTLKGVHKALIEFCKEVGIDNCHLVTWMCPLDGRRGIDEYLSMEGVEVDEVFAEHIKNKFLIHWGGYSSLR